MNSNNNNSPPKSALLDSAGSEALEPPTKRYRGANAAPVLPQNPLVATNPQLLNAYGALNNNTYGSAALLGGALAPASPQHLRGFLGGSGKAVEAKREPSQSPGATSNDGTEEVPPADVKTLFVSGLPIDTKHRELYLLFRAFSGYESCLLKGPAPAKPGQPINRKHSSPIAFVTFASRAQAEKAKTELQGVKFDPDLPTTLRLEFARSNTKASTTFNKLKRQHSPQPSAALGAALLQVHQQITLAQQQQHQNQQLAGAQQAALAAGASASPPNSVASPNTILPQPGFPPVSSTNQVHPAVLRIAQMQQVLQLAPGGFMNPGMQQPLPMQGLPPGVPPLHAPAAAVPAPAGQQRRTDPWAAAGQPHPAALAAAAAAAAGFPLL